MLFQVQLTEACERKITGKINLKMLSDSIVFSENTQLHAVILHKNVAVKYLLG